MMLRTERLLKAVFLLSSIMIAFCNDLLYAQESSQFGPWRMTDYIEPEIIVQTGHQHPVTALAFSSDGTLLASRGQHVAKVWDLRTGKELRAFAAKGEAESIAISSDAKYLVTPPGDVLWNIQTGTPLTLTSGEESISGTLFKLSPDGKILAIAENGGLFPWAKFKLFDLQSKRYVFKSDAKEANNIKSIDFSPNGKFIAYVYSGYAQEIDTQGGTVIIMDVETKKEISSFLIPEKRPSGTGWILSAAFSPDGKTLAIQMSDSINYIKFWDTYSGKLLYSIKSEKKRYSKTSCGQKSYPETIAFHRDGKMLLHGIENRCESEKDYNDIRLIDIEKQEIIQNIRTEKVTSFALSPDGKIVASGHSNGNIQLWDLATGKQVKTLQGYAQQITSIDSNPVYPQVASGCLDNTIKVWDFTGKHTILKSLVGHKDFVASLDFHPSGKFLVSSEQFSDKDMTTFSRDRYAKPDNKRTYRQISYEQLMKQSHLNLEPLNELNIMTPVEEALRSFVRKNNEKADRQIKSVEKIKTWNVETGKALHTLVRSNNISIPAGGSGWIPPRFQEVRFPKYVAFSPDGQMIAHGVSGGNIHIFDFKTGKELHNTFFDTFASPDYDENRKRQDRGDISAFTFHPNGHQLIGDDEVWDIATKRKIKKINNFDVRGSRDFVKTGMLAVNKEGSLIAGTCHEGFSVCGAICLTTLKDNNSSSKLSVRLETGDKYDHINTIVFHPNENTLAAGYDNGMIILWDADRQQEIARLQEKGNNPINSLSFSSDGRILYSSSFDAQIQLWDVRKIKKIASLVAVNDEDYVIFTPDHYYMTTKNKSGLRGVAFRIGNKSYPFEQFDVKLNRPDIVMKRIGYAKNDLIDTYYKIYKDRLKKMKIEERKLRSDFHLPQLRIVNRETLPLATKDKKIVLNIEAIDSKSIVNRLKLYVNNVPVYGKNGIDLSKKKTQLHRQRIPVELIDGKNKIQVSVLNDNGAESLKETVEIEYTGASAPSSLYVFSIGVSEYKDETIKDLDYAAKDSEDISSLFKEYAGSFDKVVVKNITNHEATKENILQIKNILRKTEVDDQVVLFFAGHGRLYNKNDYYFVTHDMNSALPVERGLFYEDIESLLYATPARKKLLLIDTCHSGEVTEYYETTLLPNTEEPGAPDTRSGTLTQFRSAKIGYPFLLQDVFVDLQFSSGAMVFSGSGGLEKAQERKEWKNGAFTRAILQGVTSNRADFNKDGIISVSELRNYVVNDVRALTGEAQVPTMRKENLEFDFPIFSQQ